jgi:hypothetical protein
LLVKLALDPAEMIESEYANLREAAVGNVEDPVVLGTEVELIGVEA